MMYSTSYLVFIYNGTLSHSAIYFQYIPSYFCFLVMESSSSKMNQGQKSNEKEENMSEPKSLNIYKEIMSTIPRRKGCWPLDLYRYEGFWYDPYTLEGILSTQDHFKPQPNNVILSSAPKSGTTWLKALSFSIMTRSHFNESTNPLLTKFSHDLVPYIWSSNFFQTHKLWISMFHFLLHAFPTLTYQNPL